jgi:hypothetical protein
MLKRVSRRRHLTGDEGMESAVVVLGAVLVVVLGAVLAVLEDKTDTAAALICEGAGDVARACGGIVGVCVVSWRGMSVRRSPVWSTEGGLMRIVILYPSRLCGVHSHRRSSMQWQCMEEFQCRERVDEDLVPVRKHR